MGNEFKAASGRTVNVAGDGAVMFGRCVGFLSREAAYDAEEYFRAKHDEDLGRWRYQLDPDYVVYPNPGLTFLTMFGPGIDLVVLRESDGMTKGYVRAEDEGGEPSPHRAQHIRAARAYFEAHPAPKPWHTAKAGEFWSVSHIGIEVCRVDDVNGTLRFVGVDGRGLSVSMPITHHSITAASRLGVESRTTK